MLCIGNLDRAVTVRIEVIDLHGQSLGLRGRKPFSEVQCGASARPALRPEASAIVKFAFWQAVPMPLG